MSSLGCTVRSELRKATAWLAHRRHEPGVSARRTCRLRRHGTGSLHAAHRPVAVTSTRLSTASQHGTQVRPESSRNSAAPGWKTKRIPEAGPSMNLPQMSQDMLLMVITQPGERGLFPARSRQRGSSRISICADANVFCVSLSLTRRGLAWPIRPCRQSIRFLTAPACRARFRSSRHLRPSRRWRSAKSSNSSLPIPAWNRT